MIIPPPLPLSSFNPLLTKLNQHPSQPTPLNPLPHPLHPHPRQLPHNPPHPLPNPTLRLLLPSLLQHILKHREDPIDVRHEDREESRVVEEMDEGGEDGRVLDEVVLDRSNADGSSAACGIGYIGGMWEDVP